MTVTVDDTQELENRIDDLIEEGWKVKRKTNKKAVLEKYSYGGGLGHLLVFLFTVWWTIGIGNLVYAGIKRYTTSRKRIIRIENGGE